MARRSPPINPAQFSRLLLRRRYLAAAAVALVLLAGYWADRQGRLYLPREDHAHYDGNRFRVTHVVDGDTLDLDTPDGDKAVTRIRLWGVNCPEIAHPQFGKPQDDPWGQDARKFTHALTLGQQVTIELDPKRTRDDFHRLLAFVHLPDGTVLNERLIVEGLAIADNRPGNPKYLHRHNERYDLLERQAKLDHKGLWQKPAKGAARRTAPAPAP